MKLIDALHYTDRLWDREGRMIDAGAPVRADAILALEKVGEEQGVEAIAEVGLHDDDEEVRRTAIRSLARCAQASHVWVVRALVEVVAGPAGNDAETRTLAVETLQAVAPPGVARDVALRLVSGAGPDLLETSEIDVVKELAEQDGDGGGPGRVVSALIDDANKERALTRQRVLQLLVAFPDPSVEELLRRVFDERHQAFAAEALGALRDARGVDPLLTLMQVGDTKSRRAAADALGELGDPRAAEALYAAAQDEDYEVRVAASNALDRMGSVAVVMAVSGAIRSMMDEGRGRLAAPDRSWTIAVESEERESQGALVPTRPRLTITRGGGQTRSRALDTTLPALRERLLAALRRWESR